MISRLFDGIDLSVILYDWARIRLASLFQFSIFAVIPVSNLFELHYIRSIYGIRSGWMDIRSVHMGQKRFPVL